MNPLKMIFNALSGQSDQAMYERYKPVLALAGANKQSIANNLLKDAFSSGLTDGYDLRLKTIELALENGANPDLLIKRQPTSPGPKTKKIYDMGWVGYGWPEFQERCLAAAVLVGNERAVSLLLKHGADPNGFNWFMGAGCEAGSRRSALQIAVITGRAECARILLQAGAQIDGDGFPGESAERIDAKVLHKGRGGHGIYPLVYAVIKNDRNMLKLLLENCREDLSKNKGAKMAHEAAGKFGRVGMMQMLDNAMNKSADRPSAAPASRRRQLTLS